MRTQQQASIEAKEAREAWERGEPIQIKTEEEKEWRSFDYTNCCPRFEIPQFFWRPAPKQKLRAFKRDEVPVGALVRYALTNGRRLIVTECWDDGFIAGSDRFSFECGKDSLDLSTDGGKTWEPFGVVE